ncbi:MAG: hypothetical protein QF685_09385 [Verrucomicrobiota bacterium]|nr:hypothetical protein [Verrucomicrobiota bacterium]
MKLLCYMLNMVIPGTGLLILKRWLKGALLTLFSIIGWGLLIPALIQGYRLFKAVTEVMDPSGDIFDAIEKGSKQIEDIMTNTLLLLILGIVGFIILKVTLIWSQAATVRAFKAEKEAEESATSQAVPPPLDSSN